MEYALLSRKSGEVVNVVNTHRSQTETAERYSEYDVKPLSQVPLATLQRYRYWNERP